MSKNRQPSGFVADLFDTGGFFYVFCLIFYHVQLDLTPVASLFQCYRHIIAKNESQIADRTSKAWEMSLWVASRCEREVPWWSKTFFCIVFDLISPVTCLFLLTEIDSSLDLRPDRKSASFVSVIANSVSFPILR